ncbi:MAG: S8 family serine peptidase, partial [Jatrophihabitans sp.]
MTVRRAGARGCAVLAFVLAGSTALVPAAAAPITPPPPPAAYVQSVMCVSDSPGPPAVANGVSWAQRTLRYTQAWRFSRGKGIRVAVIDTGVNPGPAFGSRLVGLADLVKPDLKHVPGLSDCDGHGTLVAGIIGASVDPKSGFAGVAPEATIMSIR